MIQIITDSTADLDLELCAKTGVTMLPLTVRFGEESFLDNIEITKDEFYERLKTVTELPTTTQVNPYSFEETFRKFIDQGDDVVYIGISAKLSGTLQSAILAKNNIGSDRIFIVDSLHVTLALGLLVRIACNLRDQGKTAAEIAAEITELAQRTRLYATVSSLKYLKMSGRISTASAVVGGALGICPQITMENGEIISCSKVKGRKASVSQILKLMRQNPPDLSYPVIFGSSQNESAMNELIELCQSEYDLKIDYLGALGPVVGAHGGPGAFGIAYIMAK